MSHAAGDANAIAARRRDRPPDEAREFPCPACGAALRFTPGQQALACEHCGHREEIPQTAAAIREHDLRAALLNQRRPRGWGDTAREVRCEQCGAVTIFTAEQTAGSCAFCGSPRVAQEALDESVIRPEGLIPFRIDRSRAAALFRDWLRRLWFRPSALKQAGATARLTGAYLPFWTFDTATSSAWTADAGYYYYETETYTERDAQRRTVTRTRQVRKTRWVPVSGFHADCFDDVLVGGSRGLPERLLGGITPFELDDLRPYETGYLAGFVAERYQVDLPDAWQQAQQRIEAELYQRCAAEVPGDTHRRLHVSTAFSAAAFKHLLLPVWVSAYQYGGRAYRFLVNGQTGRLRGEAPLSAWKIIGVALLIAGVAGAIYLLQHLFGAG